MSAVCASVADNADLISNATYSYKFQFRHRTGNPLDYCPCPYSCACWFHASLSRMHVLRGNVVRYLRAGFYNVAVGAFSVDTLAVIECMYCVHDGRVDLSGSPCLSSAL